MIKSISIFKCKNTFDIHNIKKSSFISKTKENINGKPETLIRKIKITNQFKTTKNSYNTCLISIEHPFTFKSTARISNKQISQVIVKNNYKAYINRKTGTLICFATKHTINNIVKFISSQLQLKYYKKTFKDLNNILDNLHMIQDVSSSQFQKIQIRDIDTSSLSGSNINHTNLYKKMNNQGNLSNISICILLANNAICFSISSKGSIVLLSNLNTIELQQFLDFLQTLK